MSTSIKMKRFKIDLNYFQSLSGTNATVAAWLEAKSRPTQTKKARNIKRCALKSCNYSAPNGFFGFPDPIKRKTLHKRWLDICGLKEAKKSDFLCFQHFHESHIIGITENCIRPKLKIGAIPIIHEAINPLSNID